MLSVLVSVTSSVEVCRTVTVVLVRESRENVLVDGIVTITVIVCSELVPAVFAPSLCLSIAEVVTTAVVVAVDSKDKDVVKVKPPTVITAGCKQIVSLIDARKNPCYSLLQMKPHWCPYSCS